MHPNASLHHCLPAGMRKTWLIFLTPRVEFYRLSCASASQLPAPTKNGWRSDLSHGPSDRGILFLLSRCCFMVPVGIPTIPLFPISSFLFFFLIPPLLSPPVESKFFSHNLSFLRRLILKKVALSFPPPPGLRVWLSVTDPERSCLILHKIQTELFFLEFELN